MEGAREQEAPREVLVLDVETTGREPGRHRVIALGAALTGRGPGAVWSTLVRIPAEAWREASEEALAVNGLDEAQCRDAPVWAQAWEALGRWVEEQQGTGRAVAAHNAEFDRGFVDAELARAEVDGGWMVERPWIDTLALARGRLGEGRGRARYGLDAVAAALGLRGRTAGAVHEAATDAALAARCYERLAGLEEAAGQIQEGLFGEAGAPHAEEEDDDDAGGPHTWPILSGEARAREHGLWMAYRTRIGLEAPPAAAHGAVELLSRDTGAHGARGEP